MPQVNDKKSAKSPDTFLKKISKYLVISKYFVGILLILCVTVIWVASSAWIQYIFGDLNYSHPYFLTYFNTCGFCFWNLGYLIRPKWRVPWNDYKQKQRIIIEDPDLFTDEEDVVHKNEVIDNISANFAEKNDKLYISAVNNKINNDIITNPCDGGKNVKESESSDINRNSENTAISANKTKELPFEHNQAQLSENNHEEHLNEHIHPTYGADHMVESTTCNSSYDKNFDNVRQESTLRNTSTAVAESCMANFDYMSMVDKGVEKNRFNANDDQIGLILENARDEGKNIEKTVYVNQYSGPIAAAGAPRPLYIPSKHELVRPYCMKRIWECASLFCVFWFIANCLFNYSLNITSVASNTTLSSTSSVWTLLLSLTLPRTRIGALKWVAVCVCMGGTIMVALSDSNSGTDTVYGDIMAIVSAFFYGAYTFILKLGLPDDERYAMGMVFGAVGVINLVFLWPGIAIFHVAGIEAFAWPTVQQFWPLVLNTIIGTNLSDVLWAQSVVLTSPVVATLGLSLTTPLAMVVDAVWKKQHYSGVYITGAILVMGGFILANLPLWEKITIRDVFFIVKDHYQRRNK